MPPVNHIDIHGPDSVQLMVARFWRPQKAVAPGIFLQAGEKLILLTKHLSQRRPGSIHFFNQLTSLESRLVMTAEVVFNRSHQVQSQPPAGFCFFHGN